MRKFKNLIYLAILLFIIGCSQFNENLLIDSSNAIQQVTLQYQFIPIQMEFWSFYITAWNMDSYPWYDQQPIIGKQNQFLLFLIRNLQDQQIFAFMYSNVITDSDVIHYLSVDGQMVELRYNPNEYEGIWICNLITIEWSNVMFETIAQTNKYIYDYKQNRFQVSKNLYIFEFQVGGQEWINKQYIASYFRGRLSQIFVTYYYRFLYKVYQERINQLRQNEYVQTISLIPDVVNFDGLLQKQFQFEQFGRKFSIFGWVKYYIYDAYILKKYLVLRLTAYRNYQDEIALGDELLKIIANINLSDEQQCGYDVTSHHYRMPFPNLINQYSINDRVIISGDLPYLEILSKWHFISFEYGLDPENGYYGPYQRTQFQITYFENYDLKSKTSYLGDELYKSLFINIKYNVIFGGDFTVYEKMKGYVARFYFKSNYQDNLNIQFYCHYSCQTCYGPLLSNCLSCNVNTQMIYLEELHQCVCPIGYQEQNQNCRSYENIYPTLYQNEIKLQSSNSQCTFGYFYLPVISKCIKCPQSNSYNLLCVDCLLNPNSWYLRPLCTTDFVTQQVNKDEDAFTEKIRNIIDYDVYYINNEYNLILLEGVSDYCDIKQINTQNCIDLDVQHLQNQLFGVCKENHYYSNKACKLLDIACIQMNQNEKKCLQCQDRYYISDDGNSCLQCPQQCQSCQSLTKCLSCKTGFGLFNGECIKCGIFCKTCVYSIAFNIMRCLNCIDNQLYYLSLNAEECKINNLENCIYAYEFVPLELTNSLDLNFPPTYYGVILNRCAKCKDGYYFHNSDFQCYQGELANCNEFVVSYDKGKYWEICLFAPYQQGILIYSFIDKCSEIALNCIYCLIDQLKIYYPVYDQIGLQKASYKCLVCQNGYYAEKKTGLCLECPTELHCLNCYQQHKYAKDNWKNEIRAHYRSSIDNLRQDHRFTEYALSQNDQDYEILCTLCEFGYEPYKDICIKVCPESCLECVIINNKNICVKCPLDLKGRNRSLINNQCVNCPNNCELCKQRDQKEVLSINPLFTNQEFAYFSYYCIFGFTGIFDQKLGLYIDCQDGPCLKQIVINLNLFCNIQEYQTQINNLKSDEDKIQFQNQNILSDHLFSQKSFFQFETKEFYQMANEKSIRQILIKIVSQQKQQCYVSDQQKIQQNFSPNIFSAIDVDLEIYGNGITTFKYQQQLLFVNFRKVHIEGVQIEVEYFIYGPNLLNFTSVFEQTVELVNINYNQNVNLTTFYIVMENAKNVIIQHFSLINYAKSFPIQSIIKIEQIQSLQTIKILNFNIRNSEFLNLHLLWFELKEDDFVEIETVNIEETKFNQALIYQSKGLLQMNQIRIYNCEIYSQSGLFLINALKYYEMKSLDFNSNFIQSGKILNMNQNSKLIQLNFTKNNIYNNSLLIYNEKEVIQYILMEKIVFELNNYTKNSTFIKLITNLQSNKQIVINQLTMLTNQLLSVVSQTNFDNLDVALIYLDIQIVEIDKINIQKAYGIPDLVIVNADKLQINSITIEQNENYIFKGLYQNYDCFLNSVLIQYDYNSIKILDVQIIEINQLVIYKAQSINQPIIEIKTSTLITQTEKIIKFSEMQLYENLILTTNKLNLASLIKILTQEVYLIIIENSIFENNLMHQYIQIDQINSGLVFFFDCKLCTILFQNLVVQKNIVTNSSNSIFYIQTQNIEIYNCTFNQNSQFNYLILQPFLFWGYQKEQEIYLEQIMETFPIKVKTGNGKIECQKIVLKNIIISNSTSSGFSFYLEKDATVLIQDATISFINSLFQNEDENGGVFLIDTQKSISLRINIKNIYASDIYIKNKGGLLYILQNYIESTHIQLSDIQIADVYSSKGSIFYVEFSSEINLQFKLENLEATYSEQGFLSFIARFNKVTNQQLTELRLERSLFQITYAKLVSIKKIIVQSLLYQSLAILTQIQFIEIQNCRIQNSTIQNSLIRMNSMQSNSQIRILDFQVTKTQILNRIPIYQNCAGFQQKIEMQRQICSQDPNLLLIPPITLLNKYSNQDLQNSYCIINQMNMFQNQISSLIDINPQTTQIQISKLHLKNINCTICNNGLININIQDDQSKIIMNSINFHNDQCGEQSCLNVIKTLSKSRLLQSFDINVYEKHFDFKLQNFICINNIAQKGTCLQIKDIKTLIKDSILQNNTAESYGGSIYVIGNQSFYLLNSLIQFNKAEFGGGLFLKDQIIQNLDKQGTKIYNNIGIKFGNNLAQLASQLAVSIDLQHHLPKIKIIEKENILIEQIQLEKYQLFLNTYSSMLYVPNGQVLSEYKFFDWKIQNYVPYNLHLRLIPLDLFNNVQQNLENSSCQISSRILTQNEDSNFTLDFTNFNQVKFQQYDYNFDNIIFYLDSELNLTLQLQFHCDSIFTPIYGKQKEVIGYHNNYFLRMNVKTLPCQLGEIKVNFDNSCQPCNGTQGFYSLILNSYNCSLKDDFSISEVKSAQLKLKPGFWRPYFNTDFISQCINLLINCNGGWIEGDTSCYDGHIGALCEECDIYNIRGFGHFSTSSKYSCGSCIQNNQNYAALTAISVWTLISILISVKSNIKINDQILLKRVISKLINIKFQYHSNLGILIKITNNHLQILSTIFTFHFQTIDGIGDIVNAVSNPIQTMTHSLDCFLKDLFDIQIHYSRIIWHLIMPFIYILIFIILFWISMKFNQLKYNSTVITTTLIYMYIYLQPFLVGRLISLLSFRQISGFQWIQANVAFRYDTPNHQKWLFSFCLPLLIFIGFIIPLFFFISLYSNKKVLNEKKTRKKWGYLYNEYKLEAYYWEIIKIVKKQCLILFISYYDEYVVKKGILILLIIQIYQKLSQQYQPYSLSLLNKLDAYSANVCQISIALGIGIYIDQQNKSYEIQILYLIILFALNLNYLFRVFNEIVSSFFDENAILVDKFKYYILNKLPWVQQYQVCKKLLQNRNIQKKRIAWRYLKLKKYLIGQAKYILQCKSNYSVKIVSQYSSN
ncbi:unnamed protein product [Paramecium sonneborni]|uniref:Uncharacterized protein n=1 Tax=Paramecium sonneborni TaxID=65129 RepID=A0A8S1R3J3_9CILI|nr:unnamed protein product [Paramecium sonneborni]